MKLCSILRSSFIVSQISKLNSQAQKNKVKDDYEDENYMALLSCKQVMYSCRLFKKFTKKDDASH